MYIAGLLLKALLVFMCHPAAYNEVLQLMCISGLQHILTFKVL